MIEPFSLFPYYSLPRSTFSLFCYFTCPKNAKKAKPSNFISIIQDVPWINLKCESLAYKWTSAFKSSPNRFRHPWMSLQVNLFKSTVYRGISHADFFYVNQERLLSLSWRQKKRTDTVARRQINIGRKNPWGEFKEKTLCIRALKSWSKVHDRRDGQGLCNSSHCHCWLMVHSIISHCLVLVSLKRCTNSIVQRLTLQRLLLWFHVQTSVLLHAGSASKNNRHVCIYQLECDIIHSSRFQLLMIKKHTTSFL